MPAHRTLFLCLLTGAAALLAPLGAGRSLAQDSEALRPTRTASPTASPTPGCAVSASQRADPAHVRAGEATTVTVHVSSRCSPLPYPLHVVLVLEQSRALDERSAAEALAVAGDVVHAVLVPANPHIQVGLAAFGDAGSLRCPLTADEEQARRCLRRADKLRGRGSGPAPADGALAAALAEARRLLRPGRAQYEPYGVREVAVVLAAPRGHGACDHGLDAARRLKGDGVLVMAVCLARDCGATCLRDLASSYRYYFTFDTASLLWTAFRKIRDELLTTRLNRLTLSYGPAEGLALVPGSAPGATVAPDGRRLDWLWHYVPRDGVTATLQLLPAAPGRQPLAREAGGTWLDNLRRTGSYALPPAEVEVVGP